MTNTLLTNSIIAKMILMEFKNNLVLAKTAKRQYENLFATDTGDTIQIRRPTRLTVSDGPTLQTQDIIQRTVPLQIAYRKHVGISLTSKELTLQLEDFQSQVIRPAMQSLANVVDSILYSTAVASVYNYVGTAGTAPNTFATINNAKAKLSSYGVPMTDRYLILSENDGAQLQSALYNTFNQNFNKDIILDSMMGRLAGFDCYTAQNVQRPTAFTGSIGTPVVNGAGQTGTSLVVSGLTAGITINAGTVFQIAGVNSVNPISYSDTTQIANFVVATTVTADGSGNATLTIAPGITTSGPYQNVTAGPANSAAIIFQATHTKNLAYHSEAFTLAMINLWSPKQGETNGAYFQNLVDKDANVALRMVRQYGIGNDQDTVRVDVLFGTDCFGEYACGVMGS